MALKLTNNAASILAGAILATDTALSVQAGDGAKFPALVAGDWFPLTIVDAGGNFEIIRVTARTGDVMTIARNQEGTAASAFSAGSRVDLRMTASALNAIVADSTTGRDAAIATAVQNEATARDGAIATAINAIKGGVSATYDTLAKIATAITDIYTQIASHTTQLADHTTQLGQKLGLSGGTVTGGLTVNGEIAATVGYIRLGTPGSGPYLQYSGGSYNAGGSTIYTTANLNPAAYVSSVRLVYAGEALGEIGGALVSGISTSTDEFGHQYVGSVSHRYLQVLTTSWWTVPYA
jgi:hypothetical protein